MRSGEVTAGARIGVLGQQPEPECGLPPDALEIGLHSPQPFLLQVVDAAGSVRLFGHHPRVLQQPQVHATRPGG